MALTWIHRGGLMLAELVGRRLRIFLVAFVPLLVGSLVVLERSAGPG
jgi:hypothetical protein